ncbi:hypothetical protein KR215_000624 [Drosophila sulfurigaster]|nr:hypothetical protein KR215_000624 [Drosophila sulfurigaster]
MYIVRTKSGYVKRHYNQLKSRSSNDNDDDKSTDFWFVPDIPTKSPESQYQDEPLNSSSAQKQAPDTPATVTQQSKEVQPARRPSGIPVRQSTRVRQGVNRFQPKDFRKSKTNNRS